MFWWTGKTTAAAAMEIRTAKRKGFLNPSVHGILILIQTRLGGAEVPNSRQREGYVYGQEYRNQKTVSGERDSHDRFQDDRHWRALASHHDTGGAVRWECLRLRDWLWRFQLRVRSHREKRYGIFARPRYRLCGPVRTGAHINYVRQRLRHRKGRKHPLRPVS